MGLDLAARTAARDLVTSASFVIVEPKSGLRRRRQRRMGAAVVTAVVVVVGMGAGLRKAASSDSGLVTVADAPESTSSMNAAAVPETWRGFSFSGHFSDGTSWAAAWSDEARSICLTVASEPDEPLCLPSDFAADAPQPELDSVVRRDAAEPGFFIGRYSLDPLVVVTDDGQPGTPVTSASPGPGGMTYVVGELGANDAIEAAPRTELGSTDDLRVTLTAAGYLCTSASGGESCTVLDDVFASPDLRGGFNDTSVVSGPLPPQADDVVARSITSGEPLASLVVEVNRGRVWVAAGTTGSDGIEVVFYRDGGVVSDLTIGAQSGADG